MLSFSTPRVSQGPLPSHHPLSQCCLIHRHDMTSILCYNQRLSIDRSLLSTLSHDTEASAQQLRVKAQQLKLECKTLKKQRDVAIEDKNEADIAWNDLVSKLKLQAYQATEECEEARQKLAPYTEQVGLLQTKLDEAGEELAETQAALKSLQPNSPSVSSSGSMGIDPMQQAKEVRTGFDAQLAVANSEKEEARKEAEALREDLNRLRGEIALKTREAERVNREHLGAIGGYQQREREWDAQQERVTQQLCSSHEEAIASVTAQVQKLQSQHENDRRAIAELSASLQDTERNRESTVKHLAQLEESLVKERARTEASVSESNILRSALSKSTEEKQSLWHRIQNLSELARVAQSTVAATWVADDSVKTCTGCTKDFSFTNRKHHVSLTLRNLGVRAGHIHRY